ncbi:MAG TPA: sensor histidine kinase [Solirubrobacterales bacterium]|jgi:anti-sigma regulatory factor (Ser/Thr protein kinase)|nr:sensor histidine kinase [Solirubrobacterales bacterium]
MKHEGFQHEALIYDGSEEYLAGTVPFLRGALAAGEPSLVAVGPEQTKLIEGELGPDAESVEFVDMRELGRNPAWIIPFWRDFVDENGGRPVRGIGEPIWSARGPAALEECQRHESLLNIAFAPAPGWSLVCPYDAGSLSDEVLEKVASSHHLVAHGAEMRESPSFDPHRDCFAGELPPPRVRVQSRGFALADLSELRSWVASVAERAGLEPGAVADLVIATNELAANSVMHGGGTGTMRLWSEDGNLLAEVEDRGRIEEPLVGRLRPGLTQEGGRGLWLANQLCDLVQIRSGDAGTVVRLHLAAREAALV